MMKLPRRTFFHLLAGAVAAPAIAPFARAHVDPSRPIRIVVGFAPGSASDIIARMVGQSLSQRLGQPVVIDNRTGVGGNLAAESVINAAPDGHTLLMVGPSNAINATLYEKLGFRFLDDVAPIAAIAHAPNVMLVHPSVAATTVADFIALARANPGTLKMASAGIGTAPHLAGELFKMKTGADLVHVAYRGGAGAYADLLDGHIDVYFPSLVSALDHIRTGRARALGLAAPSSVSLGIPAVADTVRGYEANTWFGIGAPRGTPAAIVERLNAEINAVLAAPDVAARIAALGGTIATGSPADFGRLIATETQRWARLLRASGETTS
jgi:tripartite-type tricarboxylate transporter receptor subunit TctC